MQHKTQRGEEIHLNNTKVSQKKTHKLSFRYKFQTVLCYLDVTSVIRDRKPLPSREGMCTLGEMKKKKSPIPLLTLMFIFRKFSY